MKYKLRYILSAGLMAGVLVAAPVVFAEDNTTNTGTNTTTTTSTDDMISDTSTCNFKSIEKSVSGETMDGWVKQVKAQCKPNLTLRQAARLKLRCVKAQSSIAKLHTKFGNSVTTRTQAYTELQKVLTSIDAKLKAKGVTTTELDTEITELNNKITTYTTDLAAYKQALANLKSIDCKADPDGFKAALDAARSAHDTLVTDAIAVRTYVKDTIKPTLQSIRKSLEQSESSDTSESSTDNTNTTNTSGSN